MPHNRFYVESSFEGRCQLSKEESRHLKVMRAQVGDTLELVNGRGEKAEARLLNLSGEFEILDVQKEVPQKPLILCQALVRPSKLDLIVEKGTELGMSELWLYPAQNSEKKEISDHQIKRLHHLSVAALKQCGRLTLPKILMKPPLLKWSELPHPAYFGDLEGEGLSKEQEGYLFFVGPESGFTADEKTHLKALGSQGLKLNNLTLRTETAAIVGLALLSYHAFVNQS